MRHATFIIVSLGLLLLPGCATSSGNAPVAVDTFCLQKVRTWSPDDTPESIREAEVFNETLRRRCGVKVS